MNSNIYGLTDEELHDCIESFKTFDKDNSNYIDSEELRNLLREIGLNPTDSMLMNIFKKYDIDKSGKIEFNEFIEIYKEIKNNKPSIDDVLYAFEKSDKDKSGYLDFNELKSLLVCEGNNKSETEVEAEAERIFKIIDLNKDGKISFEEFKKFLEYQD